MKFYRITHEKGGSRPHWSTTLHHAHELARHMCFPQRKWYAEWTRIDLIDLNLHRAKILWILDGGNPIGAVENSWTLAVTGELSPLVPA